ncbi:cAMP-binding protein [Schinkia azotoformans MEV2011]|uniref:cAMP-binding protein n=1 Tax=Schinkia azotoformans MEV2011 TaxID=1348973 RepID=A0A072NL45_SCHAZ|nr:Crp/Fnr family transcriptional regulator [Schinkia azotoformans]KEF38414.1 cAMP-binding protein [Schinkia azotoformans MEV2011]MEC1694156.1 Crp/Fnr family transcriptional regulator [Schinkia azotoformans]MEC1715868.1 Crp/Fnr family transcriptional regulator [Schinkia azotoformans]MEC1724838.1 Crp/Fnr family transcriptional regulator [Schinkia azotoformans]MEC1741507.1 Crp/Fnr family transcriptional regulator [Schinkia azotoformans]
MYNQFLKGIPFLKDLPDHVIGDLSAKVKIATYKKGELIYHETDLAKAVFFVKSGLVKIKTINHEGKEFVISIKRAGNVFAETSLFVDKPATYSGTAKATEKTEVLFILSSDLEEIISMNPSLAVEIIRMMGKQLRFSTSILRDVALLDIYSKTVKTIERLAHEFGTKTNDEVKIEVPLTIQDLANIIGSTRESVSRVVSKLKKQDLVTVDEKTIIINNWDDFREMFVNS